MGLINAYDSLFFDTNTQVAREKESKSEKQKHENKFLLLYKRVSIFIELSHRDVLYELGRCTFDKLLFRDIKVSILKLRDLKLALFELRDI